LRRELKNLNGQAVPTSGGLYSAVLRADTTRGVSVPQTIQVPMGTAAIRLQLELDPGDENQNYRAEVFSAGNAVWAEEPIQAESRGSRFFAPVWITPAALKPGEYRIQLSVAGKTINYYYFRIAQEVKGRPAP
jgi:hypothetical protein